VVREEYLYLSFWLDPFFLSYYFIVNIAYCILLFLGAIATFKRQQELDIEDYTQVIRSNSLPEIAFLVAAYNEAKNILIVTENLLNLTYRSKQIIVINDGSTDNTFDILKEKYELFQVPNTSKVFFTTMQVRGVYRSKIFKEILVVDKKNGQKHDALNAGLNICTSPYFITVDADTSVDNTTFESIIRPMLTDPTTVAVGTSVRIRNGCTTIFNRVGTRLFPLNYISGMQAVEYLRTFLMRPGFDDIGGNWGMSGAFTVFVTDIIVQVGGFAPTFANDLEIILRLQRVLRATKTPYQLVHLTDPVAWTEGPSTRQQLGRQRVVWQRGTLESIWYHKRMLFNPRYGAFGLIIFPFLLLFEAFEPVVELAAYIYIIVGLYLGIVSIPYVALLLIIIWGFIFVFTLFCLLIEESTFRRYTTRRSFLYLLFYSLIENFGYRQLTVFWRIKGFFSFFKRFSAIHRESKDINDVVKKTIKRGKIQW